MRIKFAIFKIKNYITILLFNYKINVARLNRFLLYHFYYIDFIIFIIIIQKDK